MYINEWLPNPMGSDAKGEWIELFNNGKEVQSLSGWHIATKTGKPAPLKGAIDPGAFLVLKKGDFTFSLHNTGESLSLYDAGGKLADQSSFLGTAQEGKSFSRISHGSDVKGQLFAWSEPTPGTPNATMLSLALINESQPFGVSLSPTTGTAGFLEAMIGVGLALAVATVFIIKSHASLSNTFFGRN